MKQRMFLSTLYVLFTISFFMVSCGKDNTETKTVSKGELIKSEKITLNVTGMTCAGCEYNTKSALKKLDGVDKVETDYKTGKTEVVYNPKKVKVDQMVESIESIGYSAAVEKTQKKETDGGQ